MTRLITEWVNVKNDISIIARESGEVWFHTAGGREREGRSIRNADDGRGRDG
jgi:hypothetical protein